MANINTKFNNQTNFQQDMTRGKKKKKKTITISF
jgi:hypothetical protein